jgi:hypothetical protein
MSAVQIEIWQVITLFILFVSGVASAGWLLLGQVDRRLDTRFDSMEKSRQEHTTHWDGKFRALLEDQQKGTDAWRNLERDFLKFRGDLPLEYVRREDFIRNQSVIEAKLDAVMLHIQNLQLQRTHHARP